MFRIERDEQRLLLLRVAEIGSLSERYDLKGIIYNSPGEFFGEVGDELFVISKGVRLCDTARIEADLVLLDKQGQAVFVIVQHGREQPQLSRAVTCGGYLSQWKPLDFPLLLSEQQRQELEGFLEVDLGKINRRQRGIWVAEDFDYEDLTATKWLRERHGVEIRCIRVTMATDSQDNDYLSCTDLSNWSLPPYRTLSFDGDKELQTEARTGGLRRQSRNQSYRAQHLKVNAGAGWVDAKLLDMGNGGIGVETPVPFPVNSRLTFSGEFHDEGSGMEIEGSALVAHCASVTNAGCRLGLSFQDVSYRRLGPSARPTEHVADKLGHIRA